MKEKSIYQSRFIERLKDFSITTDAYFEQASIELGSQNLPPPEQTDGSVYFEPINREYQAFLDEEFVETNPKGSYLSTKESRVTTKEKIAGLLSKKNKEIRILERLPKPDVPFIHRFRKNMVRFILGAIFLGIFDASFNLFSFQIIGETYFGSAILSAILAGIIIIIADLTAWLLKKWRHWSITIALLSGTFAGMNILFFSLAEMRIKYLQEITNVQGVSDPGLFVIISNIAFIAAIFIAYKYRPRADENKKFEIEIENQKNYIERQEIIDNLDYELKNLKNNQIEREREEICKISYLDECSKSVESFKNKTISKFIAANLFTRTDYQIPICFQLQLKKSNENTNREYIKNIMRNSFLVLLMLMLPLIIISQSLDLRLILDITDEDIQLCNINDIEKNYLTDDLLWEEIHVKIRIISDISYDDIFIFQINNENRIFNNLFDRREKFKIFVHEIGLKLNEISNLPRSKSSSYIFPTVMEEISQLSKSCAEKKLLLVFSDFLEHRPPISFYSDSTLELLENNPLKIVEDLGGHNLKDTIEGITVLFVYRPTSDKENKRFEVVTKFYHNLLKSYGIEILIGSNFNATYQKYN